MLFQSIEFGIFFLIVFFAGWLAFKLPLMRKYIMIFAGIVFLGYGSKILALFLIISSVSTWFFSRMIFRATEHDSKRNLFIMAISVNVLLLIVSKTGYVSGIETGFSKGAGDTFDLTSADGFMTYGVLFFTLQATGFIIDVFRGDIGEEVAFEDVLLLITYFPKLVAGPLVHNRKFLAGIEPALNSGKIDASRAFYYILRGLFKKTVLANYLAVRLVDPFYTDPGSYSSIEAFVAIVAFALQFYWNLSGLFDIGRGVSLFLGFELPANFNRPFTAESFRDFLDRFNGTLTAWGKRYIAEPMGFRKNIQAWYFVAVPALFGGLWYGTGWNGLVLGALVALVLLLEKKFSGELRVFSSELRVASSEDLETRDWISSPLTTHHSPLKLTFRVIYTIVIVSSLLVFLRSGSLTEASGIFSTIFSFEGGAGHLDALLITVLIWGIAIQFIPEEWSGMAIEKLSWLHPLTQAVILGFMVLMISSLGTGNLPNFTYFAF